MAEKRVSVRLVAEGGRQVRAELEGVGDAGAKGFGRLSREMGLANTRLAGFARRTGLALSAAAAAATASLGLIVRSTAESAAQIRQFAQVANTTPEALQRWSAGARTVGVEQEKLADILKDVNDRVGDFLQTGGGPMADFFENVAPRVGVTADQFARLSGPEALQLYVDTLDRAGLSQQEMTFYLEAMASDATRLLPLLRNGGAEMARLGDQAADLGAVLDGDALEALRRTQVALGTMSLVFDGLRNRIAVAVAPAVEALASAFVALASDGGIPRTAIDAVIGNLRRLATYAASFATFMAGRWVAGMAAAALSVRGLATALVVLRGALIRTGIGALIVGAGELVYQFSRFVERVGGVGEAFRLLGDLAREVWSRMGLSLDAALARMAASWEGLKAAGLSALEGTIAGVVGFGDRTAAVFHGAYDAAVAIWGRLPGAIGDFAFQAANGLISGIEAMLNGVVSRINLFITALNGALALLPDWAVGEGGVKIGTLDPVELGRIGNPFEGAATAAGTAAADAFSAALARTYVEPPDLGLGTMADDARARADAYREAAGMLSDAAGRPLVSWQALKDAVTRTGTEAETALGDAASSAGALTAGLNDTAAAADGAGGAARAAGTAAADSAEPALTGWRAVTAALADYAARAREIGGDIGQALIGAFTSAETAMGDFVKSGKFDFRDLVTSMIADLAKLAARRFILGPIANALSGALGGVSANILHAGGLVGEPSPGRMVPALAFAGTPRMHNGGWAGLRPDEVPAILQRGERVLSRREAAGYGKSAAVPTVNVTINARDAESFRQSRTQVAADVARAVSLGRRGM
ncbi:phage tail tape measure C-terminal domain-containing protein [Paracoccus sp. MC1862]|uniref:phage tail tape measure C-terminal domain-containing protein n=1 Tax=Paracoccus sp. MC1862 TaxID=2760307 RepID=UPI0016040B1D|nr:phage tail tape measure C-terminal domain-containing protein [Paracoccus sp. MC1862]MBB1499484.1 phage tail tape measure protein [Paracoccus sp. MC1862]QQO43974.1 phage tail tape measure protein [Paracoccus sp. MC1862]